MKQKKTGNLKTLRGFVLGVLITVLVLGVGVPALAAKEGGMVDFSAWMGDINVYVDKQLKVLTDANSNVVEPMILDGTTYVPLRAISQILGKEVGWDQATRSVYIGEQPGKGEVGVLAENLNRWNGGYEVVTGSKARYRILGDYYTPFNAMLIGTSNNVITWKLNSEYKCIDGKYVMAYNTLGDSAECKISFYNVDQYGTETLIDSFTAKCGDGPVDVHVDVTACNFVRVKTTRVSGSGYDYDVFYDITATTVG